MRLTHGEAYVFKRNNLDFKQDIDKIARLLERLPKRMERSKAMQYYNDKLRKVFGVDHFTYDSKMVVLPSEFRKVEEYYDYFEAKRILKKGQP